MWNRSRVKKDQGSRPRWAIPGGSSREACHILRASNNLTRCSPKEKKKKASSVWRSQSTCRKGRATKSDGAVHHQCVEWLERCLLALSDCGSVLF